MTEDTLNFNYLIMLLFSTGVGTWLFERLGRSRADARHAERERLNQTLQFLDGVTRARDALLERGSAKDKITAYDAMRERLSLEAGQMIAELNLDAVEALEKPSSRYVIIPSPRSGFGVFATLAFSASVFVGALFWLTLAFNLWNADGGPNLADPALQSNIVKLLGAGLGFFAFALVCRWLAFWSFDVVTERRRRKAAEELA